jgi:hypothetical protein
MILKLRLVKKPGKFCGGESGSMVSQGTRSAGLKFVHDIKSPALMTGLAQNTVS